MVILFLKNLDSVVFYSILCTKATIRLLTLKMETADPTFVTLQWKKLLKHSLLMVDKSTIIKSSVKLFY